MTKLSNLFFALLLSLTFIACNDDDNASPENLAGTSWKAVEFEATIESTANAGGTEIKTISTAAGSNFDYSLSFADITYSTEGSYDIDTEVSSNGAVISSDQSSYKEVKGNGGYTISGDTITVVGTFFNLEVNGIDFSQFQSSTMATYKVDGNKLTFTQEEESTNSFGGTSSTSKIIARSVWEKQ